MKPIALALLVSSLLVPAGANAQPASNPATPPQSLQQLPGGTSWLLQREGRTVAETYARDADVQTLHDTRSATKSITALLIAAAVQDGLLRWDTPVFEAFAAERPIQHDDAAKRAITVEDLLTMSSALDCNDWEDASPGNEENMYPQPNWLRWTLDLPTRGDARDASGRGPFAYCTAGVFLLGQLLERRAPGGLEAYQQRRLFAPLGITAWQWKRSDSGEPLTGGGLRLRTRDLARLAQLLLQQGRWQGQVLIEPVLLQHLLTVARDTPMPGLGYGHLFWRRDFKTSCGAQPGWMMAGNGGNLVAVFPQAQLSAVLTRTHYNQRGMHEQSWAFVEQQLQAQLCTMG